MEKRRALPDPPTQNALAAAAAAAKVLSSREAKPLLACCTVMMMVFKSFDYIDLSSLRNSAGFAPKKMAAA
eukprot:1158507-Pelagomonas_calceolata.AAC.9